MFHRLDLHIHSWYSADATNPPEELIAAAKEAGLSGIAITDHDNCRAHEYLRSEGLQREDGEAVDGFLVVPGVEVSTAEGHLLCLGVLLPRLKGAPAAEVYAETVRLGGVAVPAHPFDRWRAGIREPVLETLPITTLEVFNAAVTSKSYNAQAEEYASKNQLIGIAGSDAHHAGAVGVANVGFSSPVLNVGSVLSALKQGVECEKRYLSRRQGLKKHFGNWFRFTRRRRPPKV